jgi:hypothetical protein
MATYAITWCNAQDEQPISELNNNIPISLQYLPKAGDKIRYLAVNKTMTRGQVMQAVVEYVQHDFVYDVERRTNHQHVLVFVRVHKQLHEAGLEPHDETGIWSYAWPGKSK